MQQHVLLQEAVTVYNASSANLRVAIKRSMICVSLNRKTEPGISRVHKLLNLWEKTGI
jgi:hypothetical protein